MRKLGIGFISAVVLCLTGIAILPLFGRKTVSAHQCDSLVNVKRIGRACLQFFEKNQQPPSALSELYPEFIEDRETFIAAGSLKSESHIPSPPGEKVEEIRSWIEEKSSYRIERGEDMSLTISEQAGLWKDKSIRRLTFEFSEGKYLPAAVHAQTKKVRGCTLD
ncbi:MAG: hypothetical protein CMO55_19270 [Verrucomicrobiales bacterium]|nr:hypothetical protein [Verrucomicrobiales bacterium]